jgi:hypothetical protein
MSAIDANWERWPRSVCLMSPNRLSNLTIVVVEDHDELLTLWIGLRVGGTSRNQSFSRKACKLAPLKRTAHATQNAFYKQSHCARGELFY